MGCNQILPNKEKRSLEMDVQLTIDYTDRSKISMEHCKMKEDLESEIMFVKMLNTWWNT